MSSDHSDHGGARVEAGESAPRRRGNTTLTMCAVAIVASVAGLFVTWSASTAAAGAYLRPSHPARPAVTRLSTVRGPLRGGTVITVRGSGFRHIRAVLFGKKPAHIVRVASAHKIRVQVPRSPRGHTVFVRVRTNAGISPKVGKVRYTYLLAPAITHVTPSTVGIDARPTLTLTGRGFGYAKWVSIGARRARFHVVSARKITVPVDWAPSAPGGTVYVRVHTPGGTSTATAGARLTYTSKWTGATNLTAPFSGAQGVSCPTASFCMAVGNRYPDGVNNEPSTFWKGAVPVAIRYTGSRWTTASQLASKGIEIYDVSCTSATFCVAVGTTQNPKGDGSAIGGVVALYNGGTWTSSTIDTRSGAQFFHVSCTATTFCVAIGEYGISVDKPHGPSMFVYNGTTWRLSDNEPNTAGDVDCVNPTFCVSPTGVGDGFEGGVSTFNGTSWLKPVNVTGGGSGHHRYLTAVSCSSTTSCVAVGYQDTGGDRILTYRYNGRTWRLVNNRVGDFTSAGLTGLSCPTASRCVGRDIGDGAEILDGNTWSRASALGNGDGRNIRYWNDGRQDIDCASAAFCAAVSTEYDRARVNLFHG